MQPWYKRLQGLTQLIAEFIIDFHFAAKDFTRKTSL